MAHAAVDLALTALVSRFGDRISTAASVREHHGRDESYHPAAAPDAVLYAERTEDVATAVGICAEHRLPVIPFGAGTSLEGHVAALHGGLSIDLSRMSRIVEFTPEDLDCRVEAGVTRRQIDRVAGEHGLFFPIDPGADATIGGMTATGASGTNAVRYGTMRENVRGLTVVLADGRVIRTGGRARKSSSGYDLTRLFVGSEGTLGVITEIQLALHGLPEAVQVGVASFGDLRGAVAAARDVMACGVPVARIELLDDVLMDAVNRHSGLDHAVKPTLFLELHGSQASLAEQVETVSSIARGLGGEDIAWANEPASREALWRARHDAYYAALALAPGKQGWPTDVCVPISALVETITETRRDVDDAGLQAPIVGHVGDGNFHLLLLVDPADADEMARAQQVNERMVHRALAAGGTATGEHGVGYGKIAWVEAEHGPAVDVMRAIKRAVDPLGLMNPGKIFQDRPPSTR